jgi:simple sugar transport system permease protein
MSFPIVNILSATVELSTPILLVAMGEILTERSGVLNLGVEGIMLLGAIVSFWATYLGNSAAIGLLAGIAVGLLVGLLVAYWSVSLGADQVVTGLGIWILGSGLSSYLARIAFGTAPGRVVIEGIKQLNIPILSNIPILGEIFFQQNILVYLGLILVPIFWVVLFRTTIGLKIRAVGENPRAADTVGIKVFKIRYLCVLLGAALAGLAGSYLTVVRFHIWIDEIVAGRGWLALVVVWFGKRNPLRALGGAWLFGLIYALQYHFQATTPWIPYQFLLMLPYILTILFLVVMVGKEETPGAFTIPYKRE